MKMLAGLGALVLLVALGYGWWVLAVHVLWWVFIIVYVSVALIWSAGSTAWKAYYR